jgi:hypothetical protein
LSEVRDQAIANPNFFTPANFGNFVMTGNYRKIVLLEKVGAATEKFQDELLFVTGCGRSGTTLLF